MWFPSGAIAATHFFPDCAGNAEITNAHVARVEKNGALALGDGRVVVLEGIRLPGADRAPESLAGLALSRLREMAMAGPVTFTAIPPKQDRYERMRAQAFGPAREVRQSNKTTWFQVALLEQGLARVAISPDRDECAPDLYEAEQRGREKHAGIWALSANAPRAPEAMNGTGGSFQIVDGRVTNIGQNGGRMFIDFGSNGQRDFSAVIQPEDRHAFRDFDFEGLEAHRVRIRGLVQEYRGRPQIALSNPAQIEVVK
jgi:endonuclease YncB( thermonuclease family)